jgi:cobalt/nickel transport system permease protein
MHIPDGFLEPEVLVPLGIVSAGGIVLALRRVGGGSQSRAKAPIVGLSAAFVFAAQMVNFPVASQVSGHFLGATFLAILFGPWLGLLVMACVLILQALLFQDGGITALGANVFNLAIVANGLSYAVFCLVSTRARKTVDRARNGYAPPAWGRRETIAAFLAALVSTLGAAVAVAFELMPSGVAAPATLLALLLGSHLVIGLAEALITVAVLKALYKAGFDRRALAASRSYG